MRQDIYHKIYTSLHNQCGEVLEQTFFDYGAKNIVKIHVFLDDLSKWIEVLAPRKELILLTAAHKELHAGVLSLVMGNYRQSFMALRFTLERVLAAIKLSTNLISLGKWLAGKEDISWECITKSDESIFSISFIDVFCKELKEDAPNVQSIARAAYRRCSEFIHGNISTLDVLHIKYSKDYFLLWTESFESIKFVILFSLYARYWKELEASQKAEIEATVLSELGSLESIRNTISFRPHGE